MNDDPTKWYIGNTVTAARSEIIVSLLVVRDSKLPYRVHVLKHPYFPLSVHAYETFDEAAEMMSEVGYV